jgi:hypothetical protein
MSNLILPGDPLFDFTLATAPPPGVESAPFLVADAASGILRPAGDQELRDYLEGGEYSERMRAIGDSDDPEESDWLYQQSLGGGDDVGNLGDFEPG